MSKPSPFALAALFAVFATPLAMLAALPGAAIGQEDHSGLTRENYRRNCLMCHHSAAPEGVSPEILKGLTPVPGLRPRDAMPGLVCWRRCEKCKLPEPKRAAAQSSGSVESASSGGTGTL